MQMLNNGELQVTFPISTWRSISDFNKHFKWESIKKATLAAFALKVANKYLSSFYSFINLLQFYFIVILAIWPTFLKILNLNY